MFQSFAIKKTKSALRRKSSSDVQNMALSPVNAFSVADASIIEAMQALFDKLDKIFFEDTPNGEYKPHSKLGNSNNDSKELLDCLTRVADELGIQPQNREYREQFSKNYKALLPDGRWHYRLDVLEASQQGYSTIWVNGESYNLNNAVIQSGRKFRESWKQTIKMLESLKATDQWKYNLQWKSEFVPVLVDLDCKWVDFEQEYIFELIRIEKMARRFVTDVMDCDWQLIHMEDDVRKIAAREGKSTKRYQALKLKETNLKKEYISKIGRLNSVSNNRRKGRDDLDIYALQAAERILAFTETYSDSALKSVKVLATECISSFNDFRSYIRYLSRTPEKVDPHLCNNMDLVNHLVKIEETWERSQKYLQCPTNLKCLVNIIHFLIAIFTAQRTAEESFVTYSGTAFPNTHIHAQPNRCPLVAKMGRAGVTLLRCRKNDTIHSLKTVVANGKDETPDFRQEQQACSELGEEKLPSTANTLSSDASTAKTASAHSYSTEGSTATSLTADREGKNSFSMDDFCQPKEIFEHKCRDTSKGVNCKCESFEDKVMACDVEAFLAVPRFICLYYLLNPLRHASILKIFLPHYFEDFVEKDVEGNGSFKVQAPKDINKERETFVSPDPSLLSPRANNTKIGQSPFIEKSERPLLINEDTLELMLEIFSQYFKEKVCEESFLPVRREDPPQPTSICYCSSVSMSSFNKYFTEPFQEQDFSRIPKRLQSLVRSWINLQRFKGTNRGQCGRIKLIMCVITRLMDCEEHDESLNRFMGKEAALFQPALTELFHNIEKISMALQRSFPQDWNEFLHTLLLCLQSFRKQKEITKVRVTQQELTMLLDFGGDTVNSSRAENVH